MSNNPLREKSFSFAVSITLICKDLILNKKEFVLSKQLLKSGTSIGANIEEAQQPQSRADFISKLKIAIKEAYETKYWIRLLHDANYCDTEIRDTMIAKVDELILMLSASIGISIKRY